MKTFNPELLKQLYMPSPASHKGQNGKVLIIAGSKLFHAASLWPLTISSRMADMVFYASVPENNQLVQFAKEEFRNGIVVPRNKLDSYIQEADAVLIGPGLMRTEKHESRSMNKQSLRSSASPAGLQELNLEGINKLEDEGEQTYYLTKYLIENYPEKRIVFDGGSLQMMDPEWLLKMKEMPILTPHQGEFERLFHTEHGTQNTEYLSDLAQKYRSVILLKGMVDVVASPTEAVSIPGGNAGMTKGGTGDVLAGLVTSLYAKNDAFLSATCASYINKKAGESLASSMGLYFNASDLANEIPHVMAKLLS